MIHPDVNLQNFFRFQFNIEYLNYKIAAILTNINPEVLTGKSTSTKAIILYKYRYFHKVYITYKVAANENQGNYTSFLVGNNSYFT